MPSRKRLLTRASVEWQEAYENLLAVGIGERDAVFRLEGATFAGFRYQLPLQKTCLVVVTNVHGVEVIRGGEFARDGSSDDTDSIVRSVRALLSRCYAKQRNTRS